MTISKFIFASFVFALTNSGALGKKKHDHKSVVDTEVLHQGPASYSCPSGFDLNGKKCARKVIMPKMPFCQSGVLDGTNQCLDYFPAKQICPEGYIFEGSSCVIRKSAPRVPVCPPGFQISGALPVVDIGYDGHKDKKSGGAYGECVRNSNVPLDYICPPGTFQEGGHCVTRKHVPAIYYCGSQKHTLKGDRCVAVFSYDCSPDMPNLVEEGLPAAVHVVPLDGKSVIGPIGNIHGGKKHHLRALKKKKHVVDTFVPHKQAPANKDHYVVARQCQKHEDVPALKRCPNGSVPQGKDCVFVKIHELIAVCNALGDIHHCYHPEVAPAEYVCPTGFEDLGFGGYGHKDKKHGGYEGGCENVAIVPFKLMCATGLLVDGQCMIAHPAQFICQNEDGKGKHGASFDTHDCSYVEFAEPPPFLPLFA